MPIFRAQSAPIGCQTLTSCQTDARSSRIRLPVAAEGVEPSWSRV